MRAFLLGLTAVLAATAPGAVPAPLIGGVGPGSAPGAGGPGLAHLGGPPLGSTGGFGQPSCAVCHIDSPVNDPVGRLSVDGVPDRWSHGRTYVITVTIEAPETHRAGFQAALRFEGDGASAGVVVPVDTRVSVADSAGLQYVQHTPAGSDPVGPDRGSWSFEWTAPGDGSGVVVLNVAANAANGDDSPLGDLIYLAEERVSARAPGDGCCVRERNRVPVLGAGRAPGA